MKEQYSKKEIEQLILKEQHGFYVLNKKDIVLKEDAMERVASVQPTTTNNSSSASLNSDLNDAQRANPGVDEFDIDASDYDTKQSNDSVKIDVNANNTREATQEIQNLQKNPQLRNVMNNMNTKFHVRIKENKIKKLKENSVSFSKKELNEMLNK